MSAPVILTLLGCGLNGATVWAACADRRQLAMGLATLSVTAFIGALIALAVNPL